MPRSVLPIQRCGSPGSTSSATSGIGAALRLPALAVVARHQHLRLLEQRSHDVVAGRLDRVEVGGAELRHRGPRLAGVLGADQPERRRQRLARRRMPGAEQRVGPDEAHDERLRDLARAVRRLERAGDLLRLRRPLRDPEQPGVGGHEERRVGRVDGERADDRRVAVGIDPRHGEVGRGRRRRRGAVVAAARRPARRPARAPPTASRVPLPHGRRW